MLTCTNQGSVSADSAGRYRLILGGWFIDSGSFNNRSEESWSDRMNMYIGNLAVTVTEQDLQELFTPYGTVESVNIVTDRFSKQSKGFGFVDMPSNSEADKAIKALNGTPFKGKSIKVNQAEARRGKRSSRRPRY